MRTAEVRVKDAARKMAQRKVPAAACQVCGKTDGKLERHHANYQAATVVEILCPKCHRKADQRDGYARVRPTSECKVCGKTFTPKHSTAVTLCGSSQCRSSYGRLCMERALAGKIRTKCCAMCGKEFLYKKASDTTCGRSCGNKLAWTRRRWTSPTAWIDCADLETWLCLCRERLRLLCSCGG
jgi:predicted nucleic acid-binding Zn ribbon protein